MSRRSDFEAASRKQLTEPERLAEAYAGCTTKQIATAWRVYVRRYLRTDAITLHIDNDYWRARLLTTEQGLLWFDKQLEEA